MNIDHHHLRHALWLTSGRPPSAAAVSSLAVLLDVPEEVFPHLVLKGDALAAYPKARAALEASVRRVPAAPQTGRKAGLVDWARLDAARKAAALALREVIEQDLAHQDPATRLDQALSELAGMLPHTAFDAHQRVRQEG